MRSTFFTSCNRPLLVLLVMIIGCFSQISAQDFTVGTGTSTNNFRSPACPLQDFYSAGKQQYLYRAADLLAAGMNASTITAIKFPVSSLSSASNVNEGLLIKVGSTSATELDASQWESFTGTPSQTTPVDYVPVTGINSFTLATPFVWNGSDNILVEVCNSVASTTSTQSPLMPYSNTSYTSVHVNANSSGIGCDLTASGSITATTRTNTIFTSTPLANCTGTPVAGTVSTSASNTCGSDVFTVSLSGTTVAGALSFQWQSSTDNTTWANIPGASNPSYSTSQSVSTYYRAIVTCTASSNSSTSAALLVTAAPLTSGTFTIDNSVPVSTATTFKTFNEAYNKIKCGINGPVVFNVVNNATYYNEQLIMTEVPGASATNTITFNGRGASLDYLSTNSSERAIIKLDGADHIIFDSLILNILGTTTSNYGFGFHLLNNADSNTIRKCTIVNTLTLTSTSYAGIVMSGSHTNALTSGSMCDGNLVEGNKIYGGTYGITVMGSAQDAAGRNRIINNTIRDYYQYGVYVSYSAYTQIEGNDFSRPNRTSSPSSGYAVYVSNTTLLANISGNRIHAIFDSHLASTTTFYGIYFSNADADLGFENIVANNAIYDIKGAGTIYAIYNSSSNAVFYYYNTISLDDQTTNSTLPAYGYYTTQYTAGIEFKNNLISITRSGAGLKYHFYMNDDRPTLYEVNYNDYYSTINNPTIKLGYYKSNEIASLADWKTATGFDANSLDIDPVFKNLAANDLTPTSGAFSDKGTPIAGITTDINGVTRNATKPDIGAIEYTLPSCTTTFMAGEAYSSVGNNTCVDKTVLLNLKNNDIGLGLTYQWETATSLAGTWSTLSAPLQAPPYTFTTTNNNLYYRAAVACNGGTPNYSTPVQITIGGYFPAGSYTIDKTQPTDPVGTKNFNSFTVAVDALSCGIAGPVVFNVTPNTYTEQIRIVEVPNSSSVNTVTFQSQNGNAAAAELTFASSVSKNYTVQLDSAHNIIFKNLTISAADQTNGRVFDILNLASDDSILNCIIVAPVPLSNGYNSTNTAGIHAATNLKGGNLVIKGNTIKNGSKGIYMAGFSTTQFTRNNVIENNSFEAVIHQAIYAQNASGIKIKGNTIPMNSPYNLTSFNQGVMGIYLNNCDSAIEVMGNNITISNNGGYVMGIFATQNDGTPDGRGKIMNNKILAIQGLTSAIAGIKNVTCSYGDFINNDISVSSSVAGTSNSIYAAALMTNNARFTNYYNNSLLNTSPAAGFYNAALWVDHQYTSSGGFTNIFNNIIANKGGGPAAFYNYTAEHLKVDYNLLYAAGSLLVKQGPVNGSFEANFPDLETWRQAYTTELHSIVYEPAFTSTSNLQPDVTNAGSWAMQGRGTQIAENNTDFNGNARSTTLTAGVPDLGAYEFLPTVAPPALTATPAAPAAGTTQTFMMGTDTVSKITWAPGAPVPSAITMKRYSGVLPVGLPATEKSLYYYVDADATGAGPFKFNIVNNFLDPWLNTLPVKSLIKLGKTDAANAWTASAGSRVDSVFNTISDTALTFIDKFTGMTDGIAPVQQPIVTTPDSTNKGTRFWAPYGFSREMLQGNNQQMTFILAADVATEATISVHGTPFIRTYSIPAGGVITTDVIPNAGGYDARLVFEGKSDRGILIEATNPISASAVMTTGLKRVTALLLPTGTYVNHYTTLGARQFSGYPDPIMGTSWVNVIADRDNSVIEITPSGATRGGKAGGVPFRVTLNRGEVYQIQGAFLKFWDRDITGGSDNSYESVDLTGTKVVSVPNSDGVCQPIAVFAGSGGTGIRCEENRNGGEAYVFQQTYPTKAWGKYYLTAPLASRNSKNEHLFNKFRVLVTDPATVVKRNGVVMTGLTTGNFYEFTSRMPEYIEADKPILVAQFQTYFNDCGNDEYSDPGSSESMVYLTPLGHGIKKTDFYRKAAVGVTAAPTYITVIIPDAGLASLKIDGSNTFDTTYVHPEKAGYTVVMKSWASTDAVSDVESDYEFTALVHQPNNNGGFVYNVGFQVPRVNITNSSIRNVLNVSATPNTYTCVGTPFKAKIYLPAKATSLTWALSAVAGITPSADVTQSNPVPADTIEINFQEYFGYALNTELSFAQVGSYKIPVLASFNTSTASCDSKADSGFITVNVIAAPVIDYTYSYTGCINADATFNGTGTAGNGATVDRWNWSFGDNTTATTQNPSKRWNTAGTYNVSLQGIANDGCVNTATKSISVQALPTVALVVDNQSICTNGSVTFSVSNPAQGVVYSWYNVATGGTPLATGNSYTANNVQSATTYYVGATQNGCDAAQRAAAMVTIIPNVAAPVVSVDSVGTTAIRFRWIAVQNATGYEVSIDGGTTWTVPSSGSTGLSHLVSGLSPMQTVSILVRGLGGCVPTVSAAVSATTYSEEVFIPNSFTPNGDGLNDIWKVYATGIREVRLLVFNQWGQKVFEGTNPNAGWDGRQGSKDAAAGVYMYVAKIVMQTGLEINKKGSINLIR